MKQDLICNQQTLPEGELRYGLRRSADTGCGWIATYNALLILGKQVDKETLIRYYERQLPLIHGNTGTSFWGPAVFFKQQGFSVKTTMRRNQFDALAEQARVCVLFYRWRRASGWAPILSPCTKQTGASLATTLIKIPTDRICMGRVWSLF